MMQSARGRRETLGRFIYRPERLSPGEAQAIAKAYVTAPAYEEASAMMRAGRVDELQRPSVAARFARCDGGLDPAPRRQAGLNGPRDGGEIGAERQARLDRARLVLLGALLSLYVATLVWMRRMATGTPLPRFVGAAARAAAS